MAANVALMESFALPIFRAGHVPGSQRVGGASSGADLMVQVARDHGLQVFHHLSEIPGCSSEA